MITPEMLMDRATELAKQEREIEWRESIKHAYYSVYHLVQEFIEQQKIGADVSHDNIGEHQYLIERVRSIDSKLAKSIAREIQMLKDKRVTCCYYLGDNITKLIASQQLSAAQKIIERLNSLKI